MQSRSAMALVISLLCVLVLVPCSKSAVFSVDLGSEWMKVAVVDVKPGQSPIGIALNEMSKRKSPSVVAFSGGNRLLAEEAIGIAARFPERVYSRIRDMVGKPSESVKEVARSSYLPYDFVVDESGVTSIRVDSGDLYRSEELLGMILAYCRDLAEANVKSTVKDAVITVPPFFGQAERRAVVAAAQAAGINVLSLMNEHAAAALQYGIDKDFAVEPKYVLFYDMGANNAYAALVLFSSYTVKQGGKNVSHNYFELKGIRWDAEIGGQSLDTRLTEHFAKEFEKQSGVDVTEVPKAMAKLKKQAKRTKEVLSANTESPVFVDSLHDDRDFKSHITRQAFEELCRDIWDKAVVPLKKVLEDAGMTPDQLSAVELLGGGTRVPKLQQVLNQALGKGLERHLDADEAITMGAALHAANISDGIKLNRKLGMVDGASYGIVMTGNEGYDMVLPRLKKIPIKLARAVKKQEDFQVSFFYDPEGELPPGIKDREISNFAISGLTEAASKYAFFNLSAPIKSVLHFAVARSGIFSLDRAEAVIEITEWVEVPAKNTSLNSTDSKQANASVGVGAAEEGNATEKEAKKEEQQQQQQQAEMKLRKRTIRVPLKLEVVKDSGAVPEQDIGRFRSRLEKLRTIDDEKRQTEEAKNNLESYIYATKEMVESFPDLTKVSTDKQLKEFVAKLEEAGEWLYSDGEEASSTEFKKRLKELKSVGDPIFYRLEQMSARPAAVEAARRSLAEAESSIHSWRSEKPWIPETEVRQEADEFTKWLNSKEAEQKKLVLHDHPAFSSAEVYGRIDKLRVLVAKIGKTPKPKPKVEEKPALNETEHKESSDDAENPPDEAATANEDSTGTNETPPEEVHEEQVEVRDEL